MKKMLFLMVMSLFAITVAFAQTRLVSGTVKDDKGEPVPFASILVKGTKTGVAADANGAFKINAKPFASRSSGSGGVRICAREGRCIV